MTFRNYIDNDQIVEHRILIRHYNEQIFYLCVNSDIETYIKTWQPVWFCLQCKNRSSRHPEAVLSLPTAMFWPVN